MPEKKPVLIICHSAAGQMYLGVLLNRIWYSPVLAKAAEEGVRLVHTREVALILFDGDVSEHELRPSIKLLRSDPSVKDIPLVVFRTNENAQSNEYLLSEGCSAVITKPLDLAIVYGVLGKLSGEPRKAPRIPVRFRVEIEEGMPEKELVCVNLSEGGLYLRTHAALPANTVIHLKFALPRDTEAIRLAAEVIRAIPLGTHIDWEPGMGLCFTDISEDDRLRIRNFVQWEMMGDLEWKPNI
jgi:uncharacterized protein (TIGR02266 family)